MKNIFVLILTFMLSDFQFVNASTDELTPRSAQGEIQFSFNCRYFTKENFRWSALAAVDQNIPFKILFGAVFNKKTMHYVSDWQQISTQGGHTIYLNFEGYELAHAPLLALTDSEVHFKAGSTSKNVDYVFQLAEYRKRFPTTFSDDTNPTKGCIISEGDLPKN